MTKYIITKIKLDKLKISEVYNELIQMISYDKAFFEESRNMCFSFTANVKDGSYWSIYFSSLQEYVILDVVE